MTNIQKLDMYITRCERLLKQFENDQCVGYYDLGGKTLPVYKEVRYSHILKMQQIIKELKTLKLSLEMNGDI